MLVGTISKDKHVAPAKRGIKAILLFVILIVIFTFIIYQKAGVNITKDVGVNGPGVQVWLENSNPFKTITVTVNATIIFDNYEQYSNNRTFTLSPGESANGIIWVEAPSTTVLLHSWTWDTHIE
jgi:hypothetical protein